MDIMIRGKSTQWHIEGSLALFERKRTLNRRSFLAGALAAGLLPVLVHAKPKDSTLPRLSGVEWYETGEIVATGTTGSASEARKALKAYDPVTASNLLRAEYDPATGGNITINPAISADRVGTTAEGFTLYQLVLEDGSTMPFVSGVIGNNYGFGVVTIGQDPGLAIYYLNLKLSS